MERQITKDKTPHLNKYDKCSEHLLTQSDGVGRNSRSVLSSMEATTTCDYSHLNLN